MPVTDFVSTWNNDLLTVPFAPLGLIAMPGCEELGQKVNNWLMKWYEQQEALEDTPLFSLMGANRHDFLIEAHCPRFGTGEGKGMIKNSVRGYDIYILTAALLALAIVYGPHLHRYAALDRFSAFTTAALLLAAAPLLFPRHVIDLATIPLAAPSQT